MKDAKEKVIAEKKVDKTSKYAKKLMRNAALRKLENDKYASSLINGIFHDCILMNLKYI